MFNQVITKGATYFITRKRTRCTDENAKSHLSSAAVEKLKSNANTSFHEKDSKSPLLSKSS